ncbi:DUF6599 family protein [Desulfosarcina sp.]|uniref:DUF6599 family protein n=1 Tax=Desulfosarcina sp. TaxID=2027861 RepID=UPI0039708F7B
MAKRLEPLGCALKPAVHKKSGRMEFRLSMACMAILAAVGTGVYLRQFQINPAVVALRPESHQPATAPGSDQSALVEAKRFGIIPISPPERFGPDSLYEKINGRADLYLSSGFVSLNTQRFSMDQAAGIWMELFVYDMATPANAFSVFSMQRREGARTDDTVPNAYRTENALFMNHENLYLEFIGTDDSRELHHAMETLARLFVESHDGGAGTRAPGADLFPNAGFEPDTLQLITANAFGYEQLDHIYTADYLIDSIPLTAYVSQRPSMEAASALAAEYRQTLVSYGAILLDVPPPVEGAAALQIFDTYEIVFTRGRYLAGVHEAGNLEAAGILARQLAGHLEEAKR